MKKRHLFSRKTWLSVFTAITFMITEAFLCQPSVPKDVQAQEFTTAETLPVNTPVTDITGDNIKYYTFQSTEDGYFTINIKHKDITQTGRWCMVLRNKDRSYVYETMYGDSITSHKWPCVKGKTYYIDLSDSYGSSKQAYELVVTQTADPNWEREENDNQETATPLACDSPMNGMVENEGSDWFKLETPAAAGYVTFSLVHPDIAEKGGWTMTIQDASGKVYGKYNGSSINTIKYGFAPGTILYIKLTANYGDDRQLYTLTASFTPSVTFESEPNDSAANADSIAYNTDYCGVINSSADDVDYYSFTNPAAGKVTIHFGPVDISNTGKWNLTLVDASGNETSLLQTETTQDVTSLLKKGTQYLKITDSWGASNKDYTFRLSRKNYNISGKTKIQKAKLSRKHIIKYIKLGKRAKNAEKYLVKISRKKNMSDASSAEFNAVKKLDIDYYGYYKTTYYIQVRPYVTDAFGNRWYGKKSNIVKIKTKRL